MNDPLVDIYEYFAFPYRKRCRELDDACEHQPKNQWVCGCEKCGVEWKYDEFDLPYKLITGDFYREVFYHISTSNFCSKCMLLMIPFGKSLDDCTELIKCVNYLEKAVICRKKYLKTREKSKQQDSLEKCLSTQLKEC